MYYELRSITSSIADARRIYIVTRDRISKVKCFIERSLQEKMIVCQLPEKFTPVYVTQSLLPFSK